MHNITLIKGDGIGPEISAATLEVLAATGVKINWHEALAGEEALQECGQPLPEETLALIEKNGVALKGPLTTGVGKGFRSINVALRQQFKLYANLRPIKGFKGVDALYPELDFVIVRENTEDLYAGIEHMVGEDAAESIKIITRQASERIARFAFEYAIKEGRRKVTAIHKANIMKLSDGLFLEAAETVAKDYPGVQFDNLIVDNTAMQLVLKPQQFEVLLAPNLYGDILSDLAAGLIGGIGLAPGANIGAKVSVFEPVHGSAPDIAGKNLANPTAMILSATIMLKHLKEEAAALKIERALAKVLEEGLYTTADLGGKSGTKQMAEAVAGLIKKS